MIVVVDFVKQARTCASHLSSGNHFLASLSSVHKSTGISDSKFLLEALRFRVGKLRLETKTKNVGLFIQKLSQPQKLNRSFLCGGGFVINKTSLVLKNPMPISRLLFVCRNRSDHASVYYKPFSKLPAERER